MIWLFEVKKKKGGKNGSSVSHIILSLVFNWTIKLHKDKTVLSLLIRQQRYLETRMCSETHQPDSLQPLLESLLGLPLPQNGLQSANEIRCKPLGLHVDVLWHAVRALHT